MSTVSRKEPIHATTPEADAIEVENVESLPVSGQQVEEEPIVTPSTNKPVKGKVPPKLSILKTKKSESVEDEPKTPTKVKTPLTPTVKTPVEIETPKTPIRSTTPLTPTEIEIPKSPTPTPKSPTPIPKSPTPKLTTRPTIVPLSPTELDAQKRPSPSLTPEPQIPTPTSPMEMKFQESDVENEEDAVMEPEEPEVQEDETDDLRENETSSPVPLRRLVSNVSNRESESCDIEEWVDDDPPSIEIETSESKPRVILSATDVPSVLAKGLENEDEQEEYKYVGTPVIQTKEPFNEEDDNVNIEVEVEVEESDGRYLRSEQVDLLSASTNDNENAEAGSALTGNQTEETLSANSRPLSIDAESLVADEDENEEPKMTVEEPDEVTLKSDEERETTKSPSPDED